MQDIKVYKMNDYEWWASDLSIEETNDIYLKEYGLTEEDNSLDGIKECDIDTEGVWFEITGTEKEEAFKKLNGYDELITKGGPQPGDLKVRNGVYMWVTFREAIERSGDYERPYCIATTEW